MATVGELVERTRAAYESLMAVGEEIADEWQYVADLGAAWLGRLDRAAERHGGQIAPVDVETAIDRLIDEIGRISDPNRAIDWLSTFPQAVLLALELAT